MCKPRTQNVISSALFGYLSFSRTEPALKATEGKMTRPACTRLWGPVSEARARAIGALSAATSVLIKPDEVDENIEAAVAGLLPFLAIAEKL